MKCRFDSDGHCHNFAANTRDGVNVPSEDRCRRCPFYDGPARGLGDVIATAAKAVGVEPCGGCQRRREALNEIVPNPFKPG
jgi:hypothetical protein